MNKHHTSNNKRQVYDRMFQAGRGFKCVANSAKITTKKEAENVLAVVSRRGIRRYSVSGFWRE